jgi:hypothetical protein
MRAIILGTCLSLSIESTQAHDIYTGLKDRDGVSCCDYRDCRPVDTCILLNKHEGMVLDGDCVPIPWDKVLDTPAPDGGTHACWYNISRDGNLKRVIRCVLRGGMT